MKNSSAIFIQSMNVVSPLGMTAEENYVNLKSGEKGIRAINKSELSPDPVFASLIDKEKIENQSPEINLPGYSLFEKLIIRSVSQALTDADIAADDRRTLFVISTTKGNISALAQNHDHRDASAEANIFRSALRITQHFFNPNKPVVISHACISGVVALIYGRRLIEQGLYDHIIVTGADTVSPFIYLGFQSFSALSPGVCAPFSESRDGINLGEGAATIVLSTTPGKMNKSRLEVKQGAITNDANHISGPSRTGEELAAAIRLALKRSGISSKDVGFISAHGTATSFNDEMESKALRLNNLSEIPVNSLKGVFGHTLGAAGLIESIMNVMALERGEIPPTRGFRNPVLDPAVCAGAEWLTNKEMKYLLKTASGFGGCNAAIVFCKN